MAASAVHTLFQNILQAQLGATPRLIIAGSRKSESWWGNPRADRYRQPYRTVGNPSVHVQDTPPHCTALGLAPNKRRHPVTSGCHLVYNSPHCAAEPSVDPENLN